MKLLEGKSAIVTGSGRGIGRAVAKLFAQHGASVVVNDLEGEIADAVVGEIKAAGGRAVACVGTVTGPDTNVTGSNFSVNSSWSLQR